MILETPNSSNIAKLTYENDRLYIDYKTGSCYEYYGVPEVIFREAYHVESAGRWVSTRIKGKYPCRRIR